MKRSKDERKMRDEERTSVLGPHGGRGVVAVEVVVADGLGGVGLLVPALQSLDEDPPDGLRLPGVLDHGLALNEGPEPLDQSDVLNTNGTEVTSIL